MDTTTTTTATTTATDIIAEKNVLSEQDASPEATIDSTEADTCRYSSKPCSNPRALKKTGDLHSFCEFHRVMANRNQRRCEQKRRTKRQLERATQKRVAPMQPYVGSLGMNATVKVEATRGKRRRTITATLRPTSVLVSMPSIDTERTENRELQPKMLDPMPFSRGFVTGMESSISLEPYSHPVPLHDEDLQYLFMTVVDSNYSSATATPYSVAVDTNRAFVV